ncbi:tyrosine-protein phosphatase [Paenibacillus hamazuiensis]|uniref:tyrosine-protein phosphatase n=1 Tax=Paenibacillus hamazuiensis TaxID=2936508 RepID=UPI00200E0911|nr:CpsB/CapC family capsule biosynthesis tyrosine phosphatase [Paenibacillus hamazuiensis]
MIDIHCHILHGIDDGAQDLNEALAMARIAYDDGVRHIVATPHYKTGYISHKALVDERIRELQAALDEAAVGITIRRGNELCLESADFFHEHYRLQNFHYLAGGSSFLLIEQPWKGYCPDSLDIVEYLVRQGVTPIIPHPERHGFFRDNPVLLTALLEAGAWTQVTVDSLLGKNNEDAKTFAFRLLDRGEVHTIATDAHNVGRKPNLSEGFRIIEAHQGKAAADAILGRMKQVIGL